jgi:hypothetical protein
MRFCIPGTLAGEARIPRSQGVLDRYPVENVGGEGFLDACESEPWDDQRIRCEHERVKKQKPQYLRVSGGSQGRVSLQQDLSVRRKIHVQYEHFYEANSRKL